MACDVRIGTSGWHYKHWRGPFYPEALPPRDMLAFYAKRFDTVELNNTFYRLPTPHALKLWRDGTPDGFCFAIKGSRYLTHMRKLTDPEAGLARFLPLVEILGDKLGPIIFQLPPHWRLNRDRLEQFLSALPDWHRYAFEFRDPTWHVPEVFSLLERYNAAFCLYELAGVSSPIQLTADFVYVRLHGPGKAYQGSYSARALRTWTDRIREWSTRLKAVYFYFDNDQAGFAAQNALSLRRLVARLASRSASLNCPPEGNERTRAMSA
jgi:uncharacterized protein YecE (DUF72 family)